MAINYLDLPIGRKYPYEVDCVVEGEHPALPQVKTADPTPEDIKIAELILPEIRSVTG